MPRFLRFNHLSKSKSFSEDRPVPYARMVEIKPDFAAHLTAKRVPLPVSPVHSRDEERSAMSAETLSNISSPTATPTLAEVVHSKPTETHTVRIHKYKSATMTTASELASLQFEPAEDIDYARPFARAVLAAYRAGIFPGASSKDRDLAERIVRGEGGDLVFHPDYVAANELWNGKDPRIRRAALAHILGVSAEECPVEGCPYKGAGCLRCVEPGMFQGCRHSHEISKKLTCSNCSVGADSANCSIRSRRKDSVEYQGDSDHVQAAEVRYPVRANAIEGRESKMFLPFLVDIRSSTSHGLVQEPERGLYDRKIRARTSRGPGQESRVSGEGSDRRKRLLHIGPVLNDFFVPRKQGLPSDFDIWMAMRKRAIDYDPEVLAMECRLAKLWSSVLEDELGKQKAAGFEKGE